MANSPSVKAPSHPEAPRWLPGFPPAEISTGASTDTRGPNSSEVDPETLLQMAAQWAANITGANGAAIAVGDASGMSCRAGFGNAPMIGTPVSSASGLSGICLQTSKLVQCDDTESDSRVDAQACRELDLRSLLIVPVVVDAELKALIEVFSSKPHAFDGRHSENLSRMAESLAILLAKRDSALTAGSGGSSSAKKTSSLLQALDPAKDKAKSSEKGGWPRTQTVSSAKSSTVIKPPPAVAGGAGKSTPAERTQDRKSGPVQPPEARPSRWSTLSSAGKVGIAGAALVLVVGIVGFVVGWNHSSSDAVNAEAPAAREKAVAPAGPEVTVDQSALSITTPLDGSSHDAGQASQITPGKLIRRIEPTYPPSARNNGVGGSVVLTAIVGKTGAVESVKFVRGPEPLAEAAEEAVRQWRYEPYRRNGEAVAVQTTIIVKFTPPKRP